MKLRVLLVDGHPLVRRGLKVLIESQPDMCVVGEAADGLTSIDLAQRATPDIVVMDLSMPNLGGAEATERIRASGPAIKVLALTAHEDCDDLKLLLNAGVSGLVLKRSAEEELLRAIRAVALGGIYIDPAISSDPVWGGKRLPRSPGEAAGAALSERESEVLRLVAHGSSMKEAAATLELGVRTVETYKSRAMEKLQLRSRAELIRYALKCGWLRD